LKPLRSLLSLLFAALVAARPTQAPPTFTEVNVGLSSIIVSRLNFGDYDNDGNLDLGVQGWDPAAVGNPRFVKIYRNTGAAFAEETNAVLYPHNEGPIIFGDYDNDGRLDLEFGGWGGGGTGNRIYHNDGGGFFTWLNNGLRGMKGADGQWADFDNDGDLDLILVGESYDAPQGDYAQIYRNDGNGVFPLAVNLTGLYEGEVAVGDIDNDGDLDLIISGRTVGTAIYRNDGGMTFTNINAGLPPLMYSSVTWGDYDNDGDPDLALFGGNGSVATHFEIYRNDGGGTFTPIGTGFPVLHVGELRWGDYDNDGDLDLLAVGLDATGTPPGSPFARLYRNNAGTFVDAAIGLIPMVNVSTCAFGDIDNDGDLDIIMAGHDLVGQSVRVYRNNTTVANTAPAVPGGLSAIQVGGNVAFSWTASTDTQTPASGLTYNLRVGTTPGGQQIMTPMANLATGFRRVPARGNAQQNLAWTLKNLPPGTYYYSVQAIDNGYLGSGWSAEQSITVVPTPPTAFNLVSPANGATSISATPTFLWNSAAGATSYTLQVATDAGFASLVVNQSGILTTTATPGVALVATTVYFWRVTATNAGGNTLATGAPFSFTTTAVPAAAVVVVNLTAGGCGLMGLEVLIVLLALRRRLRSA